MSHLMREVMMNEDVAEEIRALSLQFISFDSYVSSRST